MTVRDRGIARGPETFGCSGTNNGVIVLAQGQSAAPCNALTSLRVCQPNPGERIKGIRATGVTLNNFALPHIGLGNTVTAQGFLAPDYTPLDGGAARHDCSAWVSPSTCTAGEVIIGVRVYYNQSGRSNVNRIAVKGLSAICARLDVTTNP